MVLEGRHQAPIYIWVAYAARAAHSMSKMSKVSAKTYTGYIYNLMNARTKYLMSHILL